MRPIHNLDDILNVVIKVVFNMSKIQNETNSQQFSIQPYKHPSCFQYVKDTKWDQFTTFSFRLTQIALLFSICQRYKMRPIHNSRRQSVIRFLVVFNMSKIQNETNSQQIGTLKRKNPCCFQYVKDTKWDQFTTCGLNEIKRSLLFSICQRYKMRPIHNYSDE